MSTLPCRPFPLIDFNLEMEREVTGKSSGDYDPGRVKVRLSVKNLRNRRVIYEREAEVRLDDVLFGRFSGRCDPRGGPAKTLRGDREGNFPRLEIWVNVAALRAKGQEKGLGGGVPPNPPGGSGQPVGRGHHPRRSRHCPPSPGSGDESAIADFTSCNFDVAS